MTETEVRDKVAQIQAALNDISRVAGLCFVDSVTVKDQTVTLGNTFKINLCIAVKGFCDNLVTLATELKAMIP